MAKYHQAAFRYIEVHGDIHEAQAEQAQDDAAVHWFEASDERRDQVNEMRDPVHRIQTKEAREIPRSPCYCARVAALRAVDSMRAQPLRIMKTPTA